MHRRSLVAYRPSIDWTAGEISRWRSHDAGKVAANVRMLDDISKKSLSAVLRRLKRNGPVLRHVGAVSPVADEDAIAPLDWPLSVPLAAPYDRTQERLSVIEDARGRFGRAQAAQEAGG